MDWFGAGEGVRSRLTVLEGDIHQPMPGLGNGDAAQVIREADEVVHCASDTSFSARKREQVERTNLQGLENLLDVVKKTRCRAFHLVSTAYVAGKAVGLCPEALRQADGFHNVYEETKFRAEWLAARRCAENAIKLYVHRPSIVYGDAETGRTLAFNGLYYPVRTVHYFQKLYTRDILENEGKKARDMGIHLNRDGTLHMPLRIVTQDDSGINLVPVDYFVRAFMAIREEAPEGGVFHIVNSRNTGIRELVDHTMRFFGLTGLRAVSPDAFAMHPANGLELMFENHVQVYGPYMMDKRVFGNSATAAVTAKHNIACPAFDYSVFAVCMRYAVAVDWGKTQGRERGEACGKKHLMDTGKSNRRKNAG